MLNHVFVGRREDDDKQRRFQQAWFPSLTGDPGVVIALRHDGVQRQDDEWRLRPLDDPESNLRKLKSALALMRECVRKTFGCKTCQSVQCHTFWHTAKCRTRVFRDTVSDTMWSVTATNKILNSGTENAETRMLQEQSSGFEFRAVRTLKRARDQGTNRSQTSICNSDG